MQFEPLPVRKPREQVEMQLRSAIVERQFQEGEKLPSETELAARFGVSRTTIREALRSLTSEGLIRKVPGANGGSFVAAVDHHSLSNQIKDGVTTVLRLGSVTMPEILQVRDLLEVPAVGLAAANRTTDQIEKIRKCIDDVKTLKLGDPRIAGLDASFHSVIADASGNRMLSAFVRALHEATRPVQYLCFTEEDGRETVLHHIAIARALTDGNAEEAKRAMQTHIDYLKGVDVDPAYGGRDPLTV